ncbi:MAG: MgtC/SapB family protein, partial [Planctomycetota bacterium]
SGVGVLFAGIRNFPSIAILGCACAMVTQRYEIQWFFAAGFFTFGALVAVSLLATSSLPGHGTTTEITSLVVFVFGGLVYFGEVALTTALTVLIVTILSLKEPLHNLARKIEAQDLYATLKFGIISVIVMPLLPNEGLEIAGLPFLNVINPRKIWLIVVLVSGIGFLGYVSSKLMGARKGIALTGILGGLASSTAVAASMAERSHESKELAPQFALAVVMASTIMFPRTILEVMFVSREVALGIALPLIGAGLFGVLASAYLWLRSRGGDERDIKLRNPFRLAPAFKFGVLFAIMLILSRLAQERFDARGVYLVAAFGGLIDSRPIALSVAELAANGKLTLREAVPAVMIAALANTFLKGFYAGILGSKSLRRKLLPAYILIIGGGVAATWGVIRYGSFMLSWLGLE